MYVTIFYMKKLTVLALLLIFSSLPSAFARGGGADVGGADLRTSTIEQIRAAFEEVIVKFRAFEIDRIKTKDDIYKIIRDLLERHDDDKDALYFFINGTMKSNEEIIQTQEQRWKLKKKLDALSEDHPDYNKVSLEYDKLVEKVRKLRFDYFSNDRFIIEEDKSCLDLEGNKKLGSVTELTPNGRICISFHELKKTAPHELRSRIAGLIAHEHSHLNGYNEPQAHRIQDTVLRFVDIIFPKQKEVYTHLESGIRGSLYSIQHSVDALFSSYDMMNIAARNSRKFKKDEAKIALRERIASIKSSITVLLRLLPSKLITGGVPLSFNSKVPQVIKTISKIRLELFYFHNILVYGFGSADDPDSDEVDVGATNDVSVIRKRLKDLKFKELIESLKKEID